MFNFITKNKLAAVILGVWAFSPGSPLPAADNSYRVGVGDLIHIKVLAEKEFSGDFRIESDGAIDYPYLRRIQAQGKTTEELAKTITERLKDGYLTEPQVTVDVGEYRSQKILLLGAVNKPGTFVLKSETRILDLISQAGGMAEKGGKQIVLLRQENGHLSEGENLEKVELSTVLSKTKAEPVVIDYYRLVHKGDFAQNIVIKGGDIINVPKANEIFVLGNVGKPGPIKYEENMTVLEAVTLAGGPTPIASTKNTYIIRPGQEGEGKIKVRLDKILKNEAPNVVVKIDDVIVVPESFF